MPSELNQFEVRLQSGAAIIASSATLLAIVWLGGASAASWGGAVVVAWCGLVWLAVTAAWRGVRLPAPWVLIPMLGFGAEAAWQWLSGTSSYPGATLTALLKLSGGGAIFYLAWFGFRRKRNLLRFGQGTWIFAGILAAEAILQSLTAHRWIYWVRDTRYADPVGPFVYHNHYAGCVEMLLPLAAFASYRSLQRSRSDDWPSYLRAAAVPILLLGSMVLSASRGGMLVVGLEVALGLALLVFVVRGHRGRILGLAMAALLACGLLVNWQPVLRHFHQLAQHDPSAITRVDADIACFQIFKTYPVSGAGFNTFASVYPRFRTHDTGLALDVAHNDWLQMLAEMGLLGAACSIGFLVLAAYAALQVLRHAQAPVFGWQLAASVGMVALLIHASFDFQFHSPANEFLFFLLAGAALTRVAKSHRPHSERAEPVLVHPTPVSRLRRPA